MSSIHNPVGQPQVHYQDGGRGVGFYGVSEHQRPSMLDGMHPGIVNHPSMYSDQRQLPPTQASEPPSNAYYSEHDTNRVSQAPEQPFYVNAKQYHRILKRRIARAKLEENLKVARTRKPYLHESRHKHAMRRPRGQGGRFLTAAEITEKEKQDKLKELEDRQNEENTAESSYDTAGPDNASTQSSKYSNDHLSEVNGDTEHPVFNHLIESNTNN